MAIHFPIPATFIHIPRTGGKSFEYWVKANITDYNIQGANCKLEQAKEIWPDLGLVFTFVRNPFDRLVSMYHYVGQEAERRIALRKTQTVDTSIEDDVRALRLYQKGFKDWITADVGEFENKELAFWYSVRQDTQVSWINTSADLIIKTENINQEFYKVQELLNCSVPLLHVNTSSHNHYREYYNSQTQRLVETIFAEDLAAFEYKF